MNRGARRVLLPVLAFALFLGVWQLAAQAFAIPSYLLPSPSAIFLAGEKLGWALPANTVATLTTILLGFGLSVLVGIPLGVLVAVSPLIADAIYPLLIFTHAIPIIAIAPVIVVIFGTDLGSRLIVVVLITFFPIMISTASGVLSTPPDMLELAEATGASKLLEIWTVRVPYAVAFIFSGLRIGVTVAVVGAVVSEFVSSDEGLGYLVVSATTRFDVPMAMSAVVVLALISVALYQLIGVIHHLFFPWARPLSDNR
jgi:NitT/TauT family transport system permease protein